MIPKTINSGLKSLIEKGKVLPVMEHFYTIQGEGAHAGKPAYFIRLAGCDVGCVWCDVKESWNVESNQLMKVEEIIAATRDSGANMVVITGGEPTLYNLTELTQKLKVAGLYVAIETSGTNPLTGEWNWICFSPKKFKAPLEEYYQKAHELKVVVFNQHDLQWAEGHAEKLNTKAVCLLQPEWEKREKMLPLIIDYVKKYPKWNISAQPTNI